MPITGLEVYGDFSAAGSLRAEDRRLLTSAQAQHKIKDVLTGIPIPIQLHFVNLPYCFDLPALPRFFRSADPVSGDQKIGYMSAAKFARAYDVQLHTGRNGLNLVFIENEGENRLPFTPWIIAHRFYHALSLAVQHRRSTNHRRLGEGLTQLLAAAARIYRRCHRSAEDDCRLWPSKHSGTGSPASDNSLAVLKWFAEEIFDTHVCRIHRLNNHLEAIAEAFAQWCITGNIRTNTLPRRVVWSAQTFEASAEEANEFHQKLLGLMQQFKEIFALELGTALYARQPLIVL